MYNIESILPTELICEIITRSMIWYNDIILVSKKWHLYASSIMKYEITNVLNDTGTWKGPITITSVNRDGAETINISSSDWNISFYGNSNRFKIFNFYFSLPTCSQEWLTTMLEKLKSITQSPKIPNLINSTSFTIDNNSKIYCYCSKCSAGCETVDTTNAMYKPKRINPTPDILSMVLTSRFPKSTSYGNRVMVETYKIRFHLGGALIHVGSVKYDPAISKWSSIYNIDSGNASYPCGHIYDIQGNYQWVLSNKSRGNS